MPYVQTRGAPIMQGGEQDKRTVSMSTWKRPEAYLWDFQHEAFKNSVPHLLKPKGSLRGIKIFDIITDPKYLLNSKLLISSQDIYSVLLHTMDIETLKRN